MSERTFEGFSAAGLRFLRDLAKNNDRAWFVPRKEIYERELLEPLRALVADASAAMRKAKIPLGAGPKGATYRIYRDVRFSPDKSPYKTNLGAFLRRDGNPDAAGGLYLHVQPGSSFMGVAFYHLDKPLLVRWREGMARDPKRFQTMLRALGRGGLHLSEHDDSLKRMPRGYEAHAGSPVAKYFRFGSFTCGEELSDADVRDAGLVDRMVALAKRAKPLLEYGWSLG